MSNYDQNTCACGANKVCECSTPTDITNNNDNTGCASDTSASIDEGENVMKVKDHLENIAMLAAKIFENIEEDVDLETWIVEQPVFKKWIVEKLELAYALIEEVSKEIIDDSNGIEDEYEDEDEDE